MKKFLPVLIVLLVFALAVGGAIYGYRQFTKAPSGIEDEGPELPASQRPYSSLTPTEDGHYMDLLITNIDVPGSKKIEFQLFYTTAEGNNQGTQGSITLKGNDTIKNQILLGSESSGKFRYDEGVEMGTLTIKFRDDKGKVIGRTATTWHLQSGTKDLSSADGKFAYELDEDSEAYFITMNTLGLPGPFNAQATSDSYGVFSSSEEALSGQVELSGKVSRWDFDNQKWIELSDNSSEELGVFISSN